MKYSLIVAIALGILATAVHADASVWTTKQTCEFSNNYWCERCSNNQINTFGQNKCVASAGNCIYGCSVMCGSTCEKNSDCKLNLTDDTCMYNGFCSACKCTYSTQECPQNGTISGNICYYGRRTCESSGCIISKCTLGEGQVCDSKDGCVAGNGMTSERYEDYTCMGDRVFAKKIFYTCNATGCLYSKSDALIEECPAGCEDGACLEPKCNFNGIIRDCNTMDGYNGAPYCIGSDIYRQYRNYSCGTDDCTFTEISIFQQRCGACSDGKCVNNITGPVEITITNNSAGPGTVTQLVNGSNSSVQRIINYSGRVYNGFLFGSRELKLPVEPGKNGMVRFTNVDSNRLSKLMVKTGGITFFSGSPNRGDYTAYFTNSGNEIVFSAESSGWIFFMPNVYDIRNAAAIY